MKTFLIVGRSFSGLSRFLLSQGHDYIVLADKAMAKNPQKKLKHRVICDFSNHDSMLKTVDDIKKPLDAVITTYENYVVPAAVIRTHLGLPGMPVEAAKRCTDKALMRQAFAKAPEKISPDFCVADSEEVIMEFAKNHDFPIILKPANLAKSLLVTKNHDLSELLQNYQRTQEIIEEVYAKYAPNNHPKLIVEEFLHGSIHSVDAFVDENGQPHVLQQVVDYLTGYDIGYNDNFHYARLLPSKLSDLDKQALRHVATLGCQALGMQSSPAHIEIIMTKQGPRIVEIGARNGGYRERMHKLANGLDVPKLATNLALGISPTIVTKHDESCAVLELFPKTPGIFMGIQNEEELQELASLEYFAIKQAVGDFVGSSSDGYKMCAIIILHNKDADQFKKDLDYVNKNVHANTQPIKN